MMEEEIIFRIVTTTDIDIDMSIKDIRRFPTYVMTFAEHAEKLVSVRYEPHKAFDKEAFIKFMTGLLKKKYKAFSVEVYEPAKKIGK